jgi:hypothetical protein
MTENSASTEKPPSPPWYGGFSIGLIFLMALILLTYTLCDFGWQQRLGPWVNYGVVVALIVVASVAMRRWRPNNDPRGTTSMSEALGQPARVRRQPPESSANGLTTD